MGSTTLYLRDGTSGQLHQQVELGLGGITHASLSLSLVSITSSQTLAPGARVSFDSGSTMAITSVPEPEAWAQTGAGLAVAALLLAGRRRLKHAPQEGA